MPACYSVFRFWRCFDDWSWSGLFILANREVKGVIHKPVAVNLQDDSLPGEHAVPLHPLLRSNFVAVMSRSQALRKMRHTRYPPGYLWDSSPTGQPLSPWHLKQYQQQSLCPLMFSTHHRWFGPISVNGSGELGVTRIGADLQSMTWILPGPYALIRVGQVCS